MGKRISEGKLKILLHIVVWAVLFVLPVYLLYDTDARERNFLMEVWFQLVCYAVIFYMSYFFLAPRFFFNGNKLAYFISSAMLIFVLTLSLGLLSNRFRPEFRDLEWEKRQMPGMAPGNSRPGLIRQPPLGRPPGPIKNWPLINFILTSCMVTGLSLGLRFSEKLMLNEKMRKEAEKEKLNSELAFLKNQINPHFLFNTLNSIYSLALMKSDMTAEAVMKLADMMRYMIQDVKNELVPLELELEYLMHYVELQKIRLNEKVAVQVNVDGDPQAFHIPPMILVPFIENAFKYGTSSHENALISINLKIKDGLLVFRVSNQLFSGREKPETFGIGISNTRRRLNLLYPGRHILELSNNGETFIVNLEISLV